MYASLSQYLPHCITYLGTPESGVLAGVVSPGINTHTQVYLLAPSDCK